MYKYVAVACCLVALCACAPQQPVEIVRYNSDVSPVGYEFQFDTSDGTSRQEKGELQNAGSENEALSVQGSYAYVSPDGKRYTVTFTADENGFHPQTRLE